MVLVVKWVKWDVVDESGCVSSGSTVGLDLTALA